jgi:glucose/mannose-6-phosphate isomerase
VIGRTTLKELNSPSVRAVDVAGMIDLVMAMPDHFQQAWADAQRVRLTLDKNRVQNIIIVGMGGSAIAGDVVRCATYASLPVPVHVCRTYRLPFQPSDKTLFITSSYSGNTEETLSAFNAARRSGAQIVCVSSGGKLTEFAKAGNLPLFKLPEGFPPRSALAFLVVPLLAIFSHCGWLTSTGSVSAYNLGDEIAALCAQLRELQKLYAPEAGDENNLAKKIAHALYQKIPLVYAGVENFEAVASRWKGQFSENGKTLAFWNVFPELNHNEIVGWGLPGAFDRNLQVIYLRDRDDHERIQRRMDITKKVIEQSGNPIIEVWSQGESRLTRMFSTIFLGDMASVYLAVLNGVDPTPVAKIDFLKSELDKTC